MAETQRVRGPVFVANVVQLVLAIICITLIQTSYKPPGLDLNTIALTYMVFCGYLLIIPMEISRTLTSGKPHKTLAMFWAFFGGVLWIAAGGVVLRTYNTLDYISGLSSVPKSSLVGGYIKNATSVLDRHIKQLLAAGIVAIMNGVVFFAEILLTFKYD